MTRMTSSSCHSRTDSLIQTLARRCTTSTACLVVPLVLVLLVVPLSAGAWTPGSTTFSVPQIRSSRNGFVYARDSTVQRSLVLLHSKIPRNDCCPVQEQPHAPSSARKFDQTRRKNASFEMIDHGRTRTLRPLIEIFVKRGGGVVAPLILSLLIFSLAPCDVLASTTTTITTKLQKNNENSFLSLSDDSISPRRSSSSPSSSSILADHASLLLASASTPESSMSTLDEVWNLVDKYYVNKASNTHWNDIRQEYATRFEKALKSPISGGDEQMKVISEMVSTLGDKYSRILTPSQYADIQKFDLLGVGVTLMPQEGRIVVGAPPLPGSASDKAGLQLGDQVIQVNGIATAGKTALDIIDQVSEHPDAPALTLTVVPQARIGEENAIERYGYDVKLDRTLMAVQNPIRYKMNDDKIGYIRVAEFNSMVLSKLEDALKAMPDAKGYVLDLRQNTGGAFQSAIEMSSLFLSNKVATYVVDNTGQRTPFQTTKEQSLAIDPDIPLVIWIDGRSASASEVLASALHDNCRAVLAGSNSFGKGLIQAVYGLRNGGGLVLTVARYVTPAGNDIQGTGIAPDIPGKVPLSIMGIPVSSDTSSIDWADVRQRLAQCKVPN